MEWQEREDVERPADESLEHPTHTGQPAALHTTEIRALAVILFALAGILQFGLSGRSTGFSYVALCLALAGCGVLLAVGLDGK
ncbi:MAG: hypothetical protein M1118_06100 [Chloroflexi bacterium]|nr:hypothetical protein [Chloroflexota bacterium]